MHPKVLLATTCRWFATARLAMALKDAGFAVEILCPNGHPASGLKAIVRTHPYHPLRPEASTRAAIVAAHPDLVIPCDDLATAHLHSTYRNTQGEPTSGNWFAALFARSLGDPASYSVSAARSHLIALAEAEGIRIPNTSIVENARQLDTWLSQHGLPAVLKTDGTSGGVGVRIAETPDEAHEAFAALNTPPLVARVVKRAIVDRDINLLVPCLLRRRPRINVQGFIRGHDATSAVACWQGEVLAMNHFDVLHTWKPKGPASVLRVVENQEMTRAAVRLVGKLKLSGLYGFDFMIEAETRNAFLIEMNPRATQTCHLSLGCGRDLLGALWSAVTGEPGREPQSITDKKEIALFPQEWQRNPASQYLLTAYHDVPWGEPGLVRSSIESQPLEGAWSAASFARAYTKLPWHRN